MFSKKFQESIKIALLTDRLPMCLSMCSTYIRVLILGSMKHLSSQDLKAVTNDVHSAGNRTVTFRVLSSPTFGRLLRISSDNSTEDVSIFTQYLVSPDICFTELGGPCICLCPVQPSRHALLLRPLLISAALTLKPDTLGA